MRMPILYTTALLLTLTSLSFGYHSFEDENTSQQGRPIAKDEDGLFFHQKSLAEYADAIAEEKNVLKLKREAFLLLNPLKPRKGKIEDDKILTGRINLLYLRIHELLLESLDNKHLPDIQKEEFENLIEERQASYNAIAVCRRKVVFAGYAFLRDFSDVLICGHERIRFHAKKSYMKNQSYDNALNTFNDYLEKKKNVVLNHLNEKLPNNQQNYPEWLEDEIIRSELSSYREKLIQAKESGNALPLEANPVSQSVADIPKVGLLKLYPAPDNQGHTLSCAAQAIVDEMAAQAGFRAALFNGKLSKGYAYYRMQREDEIQDPEIAKTKREYDRGVPGVAFALEVLSKNPIPKYGKTDFSIDNLSPENVEHGLKQIADLKGPDQMGYAVKKWKPIHFDSVNKIETLKNTLATTKKGIILELNTDARKIVEDWVQPEAGSGKMGHVINVIDYGKGINRVTGHEEDYFLVRDTFAPDKRPIHYKISARKLAEFGSAAFQIDSIALAKVSAEHRSIQMSADYDEQLKRKATMKEIAKKNEPKEEFDRSEIIDSLLLKYKKVRPDSIDFEKLLEDTHKYEGLIKSKNFIDK